MSKLFNLKSLPSKPWITLLILEDLMPVHFLITMNYDEHRFGILLSVNMILPIGYEATLKN